MSGPNLMRERDAREFIRAALDGSGVFDGVYLGAFPRDDGRSAGDQLTVMIEPSESTTFDAWSGGLGGVADYVEVRTNLIFIARRRDGLDCDAEAERLYGTAANLLTGSKLGGLAMPAFTRLGRATWRPAVAPSRRLDCLLTYRYLTDVSLNVDP